MSKYPRHPKTIAVIRRAREIIADPARWTQDAYALDAEGNVRHARHAKAVRFSAVAALYRAAMEIIPDHYGSAQLAGDDAYHAVNSRHGTIVRYDGLYAINAKGHQAVLDLFDQTLAYSRVIELFEEAPICPE